LQRQHRFYAAALVFKGGLERACQTIAYTFQGGIYGFLYVLKILDRLFQLRCQRF
jgi:hypothetical protein